MSMLVERDPAGRAAAGVEDPEVSEQANELAEYKLRNACRVPALLTQIQAPLAVVVAADSAYDKEAVYEAIEAHSRNWTKDARGDSAATKRDAQSEFEHRHAGARFEHSTHPPDDR